MTFLQTTLAFLRYQKFKTMTGLYNDSTKMIDIWIKKSNVNLTIETWGYLSSKLLKYNIYCLFLQSNSCYMFVLRQKPCFDIIRIKHKVCEHELHQDYRVHFFFNFKMIYLYIFNTLIKLCVGSSHLAYMDAIGNNMFIFKCNEYKYMYNE